MTLQSREGVGESNMVCPYTKKCPLLKSRDEGGARKQYQDVCSRGEGAYTGCKQFAIEECGEFEVVGGEEVPVRSESSIYFVGKAGVAIIPQQIKNGLEGRTT